MTSISPVLSLERLGKGPGRPRGGSVMRRQTVVGLGCLLAVAGLLLLASPFDVLGDTGSANDRSGKRKPRSSKAHRAIRTNALTTIEDGRYIFRFDTFGDEEFWGDALKLHQAIQGASFGGVGPGVSPKTALGVGLKVDADALPRKLRGQLKNGRVNLDDPATTLALLKLNAVVGVTGFFNEDGSLRSFGIRCALCHSTVDDSLAPGVGHRLDGWANRDLNVGAIIALAPDLSVVTDLLGVDDPTVRKVLNSWGPGKFDAELILDGKTM